MEKEFNIFGEFESVEGKYLKELENEPLVDSGEEDDDLDDIVAKKTEEAKKASKVTKTDDDEQEDDEEETDSQETESEESEEDVDEDKGNESKGKTYSFKALANHLADEGVIDYEDSEDEEDSPEVIAKAVMTTAQNMLDEYKASLSEDGKKFLAYLEKGGDVSKYIDKVSSTSVLDLDISETENQKKILTEYLKKSDYGDEDIKEILEDYEDGLILEKQAKRAIKHLEKIYEKEKEELVKAQESELASKQEAIQKQIKQLEDTIENSEEIAGIKVTKAERKALHSYMLDRDKEGLTGWQKDLKQGGTKTQLALAFLQMKKFDFKKIAKQATTEVTKQYKDIFDGKNTTVKGRSQKVENQGNGDLSVFAKNLV